MPEPRAATPEGGDSYLACFPARPIRLSRDRPTTIGRADGNTIVLADGQVSRRHAIVEWSDGRFAVRDAGSRNGVYVNDTRLADGEERELRPDDKIRIGERVFTLIEGDEHAVRRLFLHKRREKHSGVTDVVRASDLARPAHALSGSLADFGLAELLQALELGRKTGRAVIGCEAGRGELLLRDGHLVGASLEGLSGKEAVYAMLALEAGSFDFEARPVEAGREVLAATAGLLMEAFRRIDEERRAGVEEPGAQARPEEEPAEHPDGSDGPLERGDADARDQADETVAPENE